MILIWFYLMILTLSKTVQDIISSVDKIHLSTCKY